MIVKRFHDFSLKKRAKTEKNGENCMKTGFSGPPGASSFERTGPVRSNGPRGAGMPPGGLKQRPSSFERMAPGWQNAVFCFCDNFGYETRNFKFFILIKSASRILAYQMIIKI